MRRIEPEKDPMTLEWWAVVKADPQPRDKDGGAYLVKLNVRKEWRCSCPHFQIRLKGTRQTCKHIDRVVKQRDQVPRPAPVASPEDPALEPPTPEPAESGT